MSVPTDDFKDLIPAPTSSLCGAFLAALLQLPSKLWQWMVSVCKTDGTINGVSEIGDYMFSAAPLAETDYRKLCNGQEISTTTYAALYALIGDSYGTPSVGTVFKLPDMRCRFPLCVGTLPSGPAVALAGTGGAEKVALTDADQLPAHGHVMFSDEEVASSGVPTLATDPIARTATSTPKGQDFEYCIQVGTTDPTVGATGDTGASDEHDNMPPWMGVYVYIRVQ